MAHNMMHIDFTESLRLEVETARNDAFVWGMSAWSGYRFGGEADTPDAGSQWANILGETHDIKVQRGAKRDGANVTVEAGALTATVYDPLVDPSTNPYIKPGTPIRLMHKNTPVFTGVLRQVQVTYPKRELGNDRTPRVFLSAVDRVKDLANIMRYGALENFYPERVKDLLDKHGIKNSVDSVQPYVVLERNNYDSTLLNHLNLATTSVKGQWYVDKSNVVRANPGIGAVYHTGFGNLFTNPRLFGTEVATGWLPYTSNASGVTRALTEVNPNQQRQSVTVGTLSSGGLAGVQQIVPVSPGATYTVSADVTMNTGSNRRVRVSVQRRNSGVNVGTAVSTTTTTNGRVVLNVPTHASYFDELVVVFGIGPVSGSVTNQWFTITKPLLQEGTWSGDHNAVPLFTDVHDHSPNVYQYVDIGVMYDTEELINELTITNLTYDEDENGPKSVHTNWGPYRNPTSVATYGSYAQTIEVNVPEYWLGTLAADVLNETLEPRLHVSSLRVNFSEHPEAAAALEVYDRIQVEFSADEVHIDEEHTIYSISHEIEARNHTHSWMTNLTIGGNKYGS